KKGYLDPRHVLPAAALSVYWCWPGLLTLGYRLRQGWRRATMLLPRTDAPVHFRRWPTMTPARCALVILAGLSWWMIHPTLTWGLHAERHGYRAAGEWL